MKLMIRVSFVSLLVSFAWTLAAHAQDAIGLNFTVAETDSQPSPTAASSSIEPTPSQSIPTVNTTAIDPSPQADKHHDRKQDTIALSFALSVQQPAPTVPRQAPTVQAAQADIFDGGSNSIVARTVGHAEGTRTVNGSKTRAYYGHSDPGNGVWNLGSFSYQHTAQSPEAADEQQLRRLQAQVETIRQRAAAARLNLSLAEELNALDLANQSPLAALDTPGYVEWLKQARTRGLSGSEAVLWARTRSYWDVQRHCWNAPGLGNSEESITHDQHRRLTAIAQVLNHYQPQQAAQRLEDKPQNKIADRPQEAIAHRIIVHERSQP